MLEEISEPNVDETRRTASRKRVTTALNKDTDIARSTTDLWPKNPMEKLGNRMLDGVENSVASTTDLWPENPESRRWMMAGSEARENAFAQTLKMVGEVSLFVVDKNHNHHQFHHDN